MDMYRAFLAIIISFLILIGYQYFFVAPTVNQAVPEQETAQQRSETAPVATGQQSPSVIGQGPSVPAPVNNVAIDSTARDIVVETPLYTAVISEQGGGFKSFNLKNYKKELNGETGFMELVQTELPSELPVIFSLQNGGPQGLHVFKADKEKIVLDGDSGKQSLVMTASLDNGIEIIRTLVFDPATYLIDDKYQVSNSSSVPLTGAASAVASAIVGL